MIEKVLRVARRFCVFPCNQEKEALIKDWGNQATQDPTKIRAWWDRHPTAKVAIPTGKRNNLWVLDTDVDIENNKFGERNLKNLCNPGDTMTVRTPRGGIHRYYEWEKDIEIRNSTSGIGKHIDIRGEGGYVLVPPSDGYAVFGKVRSINRCSDDMFKIIRNRVEEKTIQMSTAVQILPSKKDLAQSLNKLDPRKFRDRDAWMRLLMATHHSCCGERWGMELFTEWSLRDDHKFEKDPAEYIQTMWESCKEASSSGARATIGTIKHLATPNAKSADEQFTQVESNDGPVARWDRDGRGNRLGTPRNFHNFTTELKVGPKQNGLSLLFKFNELTLSPEFARTPPWAPENEDWTNRPVKDSDETSIQIYINSTYKTVFAIEVVRRGLMHSAMLNTYHPVKQHLESLEWDGLRRVDMWLTSYASAADTAYTKVAGASCLVSAIARIYEPGCEVHTMLVLEGDQGTGKSRLVKTLGGNFYASPDLDIGEKDAIINMSGSWILEMEEMECVSRAETKALKKFVSCPSDKMRPPYGRISGMIPRQSIFIGTINPPPDGAYLKDETGGRRFLPIATGKIHIDNFIRDIDQLWAEALIMYRSGREWILNEEEAEEAVSEQRKRRAEDPWTDDVVAILSTDSMASKEFITSSLILQHLGIDSNRLTQMHQRRMSIILLSMGYQTTTRTVNRHRIRGFKLKPEYEDEDAS